MDFIVYVAFCLKNSQTMVMILSPLPSTPNICCMSTAHCLGPLPSVRPPTPTLHFTSAAPPHPPHTLLTQCSPLQAHHTSCCFSKNLCSLSPSRSYSFYGPRSHYFPVELCMTPAYVRVHSMSLFGASLSLIHRSLAISTTLYCDESGISEF